MHYDLQSQLQPHCIGASQCGSMPETSSGCTPESLDGSTMNNLMLEGFRSIGHKSGSFSHCFDSVIGSSSGQWYPCGNFGIPSQVIPRCSYGMSALEVVGLIIEAKMSPIPNQRIDQRTGKPPLWISKTRYCHYPFSICHTQTETPNAINLTLDLPYFPWLTMRVINAACRLASRNLRGKESEINWLPQNLRDPSGTKTEPCGLKKTERFGKSICLTQRARHIIGK